MSNLTSIEKTSKANKPKRSNLGANKKIELMDIILFVFLTFFALVIVVPFLNVLVVSITSQKEYFTRPLLLFPSAPTLQSYQNLFEDGRIWVGYKTTLTFLAVGVPVNLFLTTSMAYALSKRNFPGKKIIFILILITMLFNGGIIPLYLVMKTLSLTNKIWSVIFAYGMNTFYMIITRTYFQTIPDSLVESAELDGAGEWRILFQLILPLSTPILATITLFYCVDRWNEWFYAMIFIRKSSMVPLQLVLRSIVLESQVLEALQSGASGASLEDETFSMGMKMAAVVVTMVPIMCVFPFLQKHFVKGIMIGAIKA